MIRNMNDESWANIPMKGLINYQASSLGRIRQLNLYSKEYEIVTTSYLNGYRLLEAPDSLSIYRKYEVDKLVALSFLPPPRGFEGVFLHEQKDLSFVSIIHNNGITADNRPENLSWSYASNLLNYGKHNDFISYIYKVLVKDIITSEEILINSLDDLSVYLNVNDVGILDLVKRHSYIPYKDRYVFTIISDDQAKVIGRPLTAEVLCKNYLTGEIKIFDSIGRASIATCIKKDSIAIKMDANKFGLIGTMLSGYDFISMNNVQLNDLPKWPTFSKEQAMESRNIYFNVVSKRQSIYTEIEVFDVASGTACLHNSLINATKGSEDLYLIIFDYVLGKKRSDRYLKIFNGKIYRAIGDLRSWNDSVVIEVGGSRNSGVMEHFSNFNTPSQVDYKKKSTCI